MEAKKEWKTPVPFYHLKSIYLLSLINLSPVPYFMNGDDLTIVTDFIYDSPVPNSELIESGKIFS